MSARRALVTGGAGFVGSHLVEALAAEGCEVSVLDDLSRGSRVWLPPSCPLYEVDIRDREAVREAVEDARPEAVAHLAAMHYIPAVDDAPELAREVNVTGTANVLDALEHARPASVVFASTAAVYPDSGEPLPESVPAAPLDIYGETKLEGERLLERFAARASARCVAARIFNVMGPRETNPHVVPEIAAQLRGGAEHLELGSLEPRRDLTHVRDVAAALSSLLLGAPPGFTVYNVGSGRAMSVRELVQACEAICGRSIPVRQAPARVRRVDRAVLVADVSALREDFGWRPSRDVESTLAELLGRA